MDAVGFETLTVDNTSGGVGPGTASATAAFGEANYAVFGPLETAQVRWTAGGTAPTTTVGHILDPGDSLIYTGDVSAVRFIRTGGTSGSLPASYFHRG